MTRIFLVLTGTLAFVFASSLEAQTEAPKKAPKALLDVQQDVLILRGSGKQDKVLLLSLTADEFQYKSLKFGTINKTTVKEKTIVAIQTAEGVVYAANFKTGKYELANDPKAKAADPAVPVGKAPGAEAAKISVVLAEGLGETPEAALKDALSAAIKQSVGGLVDAETIVKNDQVISDKILAYSNGFVTKYEELSKKEEGKLVRVRIKAEVEQGKLFERLKAVNVIVANVAGNDLATQIATQEEAKRQGRELLQGIMKGFPEDLIKATVDAKPRVVRQNAERADLAFRSHITVDLKAYEAHTLKLAQALAKMATERGEALLVRGKSARGELVGRLNKPATIVLNHSRTANLDRSGWTYFVIDPAMAQAFRDRLGKVPTIKIDLIDKAGEIVASDTFVAQPEHEASKTRAVLITKGFRSNEYDFQHPNFWLAPYFLNDDEARATLTFERTISLTLAELSRVAAIKCAVQY